jgi:hypothetical protein
MLCCATFSLASAVAITTVPDVTVTKGIGGLASCFHIWVMASFIVLSLMEGGLNMVTTCK